jgi:hypothetical protein
MAKQHKKSKEKSTARPPAQTPAVPPPDDPLRRSTEFDPSREYNSREMAEKRLEAIRKTRKMPTSAEESSTTTPNDVQGNESDTT